MEHQYITPSEEEGMRERLNGKYSFLLWKFLSEFLRANEKEEMETNGFGLITLRKVLNLPDTGDYYNDVTKLKEEIIKPAISELNSKSDLLIKILSKKPRGIVVGLSFKIKRKSDILFS